MVKALSEASESAWASLIAMDSDRLGKALSDTMAAWRTMLPYTVDPFGEDDPAKSQELSSFWKAYDRPRTRGCLFSGAGGGFLMVISDTPVKNGLKVKLNHAHYCKPFPSDTVDSAPRPTRLFT